MNLSNENRLLLYCAQTRIPEDTLNKVKDIMSLPLNWEEVLESASWYGISPLLYKNLNDIYEGHFVPREIMDKLRADYHRNLAWNMYIYEELKRILDAFHEKGVEVIILKGVALAKFVYGDISLRPMGDIDLMVKKEDLPYAEKIMLELGYLFQVNKSSEWYKENHNHIEYTNQEKNIPVEIHWHRSNKSHPDRICVNDTSIIEGWWEHAKNIEFNGIKALILSPEDLILHLCLHFIKHRFLNQSGGFNGGFNSKGALIQLCDIFQILIHYRTEINWEILKSKAEKYGIESLISTTLFVLNEFRKENDDVFHDAFCVFTAESIDKELIGLINKKILIREGDRTIVTNLLIQSQIDCSFYETVKTLLRYLFPGPVVISKRYSVPISSKRFFFYYLNRPFSLLLKYGKLIFVIPRIKEDVILRRWINFKD